MKNLLLFALLYVPFCQMAQTPEIALLRQGYKPEQIENALKSSDQPSGHSNFGAPDMVKIRVLVIEELKVLNANQVMVTTSHRVVEDFNWGSMQFDPVNGTFIQQDSVVLKVLGLEGKKNWKPGTDTLTNHAFVNPSKTCEDILNVFFFEHQLGASVGETRFVGFKCDLPKERNKKNSLPWTIPQEPKNPWTPFLIVLGLSGIIFLALQFKRQALIPHAQRP